MYLHKEDKKLMKDIISMVSELSNIEETIIEKDYYVTMILKELAISDFSVVFKGGTSLSKAYHVINRFSEDIDITFEECLGEAKRKNVKHSLLKKVSERLELQIENWNETKSKRKYNYYNFSYIPISEASDSSNLRPYIKLETALMSASYPTENKKIVSIIHEYLKDTEPDIIKNFDLEPFVMKTQNLNRTFIDKLFAVCDYYMNDLATRNSRHLYDIYKLRPYITFDDDFMFLVDRVRKDRALLDIKVTPSARAEVDVLQKAKELIENKFYFNDYIDSTMKLTNDIVKYEDAGQIYLEIMEKLFAN